MHKQELLQKIKHDVAQLNGYHKMEDCTYQPMFMALMDAVAQRYAIACCEKQKAEIISSFGGDQFSRHIKDVVNRCKNVAE